MRATLIREREDGVSVPYVDLRLSKEETIVLHRLLGYHLIGSGSADFRMFCNMHAQIQFILDPAYDTGFYNELDLTEDRAPHEKHLNVIGAKSSSGSECLKFLEDIQ